MSAKPINIFETRNIRAKLINLSNHIHGSVKSP